MYETHSLYCPWQEGQPNLFGLCMLYFLVKAADFQKAVSGYPAFITTWYVGRRLTKVWGIISLLNVEARCLAADQAGLFPELAGPTGHAQAAK